MILVDTSVWVNHLSDTDEALIARLDRGEVMMHPFVLGELALGNLAQRDLVLDAMAGLPRTAVASDDEVLRLIRLERLYGSGMGYIDAHLLAATMLTPDTAIWTQDRRLEVAAQRIGLAWSP